jgi:hypothetical protein
MKVTICGSVNFSNEIIEISKKLTELGHETTIPTYTQKIMEGELTLEEFIKEKEEKGDFDLRKRSNEDLIKKYYHRIEVSDAILVVNVDKKKIANYIGGNAFLEIGFAYVQDKKIFLLNPIPDMHYKDEIVAMNPIIINSDLEKIN